MIWPQVPPTVVSLFNLKYTACAFLAALGQWLVIGAISHYIGAISPIDCFAAAVALCDMRDAQPTLREQRQRPGRGQREHRSTTLKTNTW